MHDTSQFVGAAWAYEQQYASTGTLEAATVTKLLRNLAMVVAIPLLAIAYRSAPSSPRHDGVAPVASSDARPRRLATVPWFLYAFLGFCVLRTTVDALPRAIDGEARVAWDGLLGAAMLASECCFMLAMSAIGLQTRLEGLRRIGFKPLAVGFAGALCVGAVSAAGIVL